MNASVGLPDLDGLVAFPRQNGEPVFDAPWQSRAFGMVVAMHKQGLYPWDDFKARLIEQIGSVDCKAQAQVDHDHDHHHDHSHHHDDHDHSHDHSGYYDQFVEALTRLVVEKGLLSQTEIEARTSEFQTGIRQEVF